MFRFKKLKKPVSCVLLLAMLFSLVSSFAYAETESVSDAPIVEAQAKINNSEPAAAVDDPDETEDQLSSDTDEDLIEEKTKLRKESDPDNEDTEDEIDLKDKSDVLDEVSDLNVLGNGVTEEIAEEIATKTTDVKKLLKKSNASDEEQETQVVAQDSDKTSELSTVFFTDDSSADDDEDNAAHNVDIENVTDDPTSDFETEAETSTADDEDTEQDNSNNDEDKNTENNNNESSDASEADKENELKDGAESDDPTGQEDESESSQENSVEQSENTDDAQMNQGFGDGPVFFSSTIEIILPPIGGSDQDAEPSDPDETLVEEEPEKPAAEEHEMPPVTFESEIDGTIVKVVADEDTFPEGTTMHLAIVDDNQVLETIENSINDNVLGIRAIDITFKDKDGNIIEPLREVHVTFKDQQIESSDNVSVVHLAEDQEPAIIDCEDKDTDIDEIAFMSDSFSIYALVYTGTIETTVLTADGYNFKIQVDFDESAKIPDNAVLSAVEILSIDSSFNNYIEQSASALGITPEQVKFARVFDIHIQDPETGEKIQPQSDVKVNMELIDPEVNVDDDILVTHFAEVANSTDTITQNIEAESNGGSVEFYADSFSVYVFQQITLVKEITTTDGHTYRVTVKYGPEAEIPDSVDLMVSEITDEQESEAYNNYIKEVSDLLNEEVFPYTKFLDISIVDNADNSIHYQPKTDVDVSIELIGINISDQDYSLIHFGEHPEQLDVDTSDNALAFVTSGFSVYAIVHGPDPIELGYHRITTMEDFVEYAARGIYVANPGGYFMKNALYNVNGSARTGILKTKPPTSSPTVEASKYYFELVDGTTNQYYAYCYDSNSVKQYVKNVGTNSLSFTTEENKTAFTVSLATEDGKFNVFANGFYWNMQGSAAGKGFAAYNQNNDDSKLHFWRYDEVDGDAYGLDGKTYGLMSYNGGTAGKALIASSATETSLAAQLMTIMTNSNDETDILYIPRDQDITMWTFEWVSGAKYYLKTDIDGETKYLKVNNSGVTLSDTPFVLDVTPGSAELHAGQLAFSSGSSAITYSGEVETGFIAGAFSDSGIWLNLLDFSELTSDYFATYTAAKVSVSDSEKVTNGSRIIIYTRTWNDAKKRYEFYAVDANGNLVRVYESGDNIQWVGSALNTMLWNFTEYYYEGTTTPNHYYEFYNQYSQKFIAPQIRDGQILSDNPIGVNLEGRQYGLYYSPILAWDDPYYTYAGLVANASEAKINSVPMSQCEDFYFAIMEDLPVSDALPTVDTVEHTQYGISAKMVNFTTNDVQNSFLGSSVGGAVTTTVPNLLSTNLGADGYPTAAGGSLGSLFANGQEVNHLFIDSTYQVSGYYEFDSTQNFASLQPDGNFKVYSVLGTSDAGNSRPSMKHGQFLPYNDLTPGLLASVNGRNLYTAELVPLDNTDPRKNEKMYLVPKPDYYFGVEISASFVQTPSGLDAWGHDIIYEFTGDDDFWLYVDGELVIDLGGIHSALPGSVNYKTGEVNVNGRHTNLYTLFSENYQKRGIPAEEREQMLAEIFAPYTDESGATGYTFKDYTSHTMKIFFMERGAGASNLHMRFNLDSVKPGQIILNKTISGTEEQDYKLAEYAYQIYYQTQDDQPFVRLNEETETQSFINVVYQGSNIPAKFAATYSPPGTDKVYEDVYFLTPNQTVAISVPDETINYYVVECGVNTQVYDHVYVNSEEIVGIEIDGTTRKDFPTTASTVSLRPRVAYENHVNEEARRTLTIIKKLYDEHDNLIIDDPTGFTFRVSLGTENDSSLTPANLRDYLVRDQDGNYCGWDVTNQTFTSLGKNNYDDLTASEKLAATFQTSPNGAISKIPTGYKVEIRELLVGTKFLVEERNSDMPKGYSLIQYDRVGGSYLVGEGDTINSGIVRDNDSPEILVKNRRGFGLTINKIWSDASFMSWHNDIFFAVYINNILQPDTVKCLHSTDRSVYYYFDSLGGGASSLADYQIKEVKLEGNYTIDPDTKIVSGFSSVTAVENGETLTVSTRTKSDNQLQNYVYTATYTIGSPSGFAHNARTDSVTNSRHGIVLKKEDWSGNPLADAVFTLTDRDGNQVGSGTYTSDENGQITIAYINVDVPYTLTETKAPAGYHAMEVPLVFMLHSDGTVEVLQSVTGYYTLSQASDNAMATITLKNKPFELRVVKYGVTSDNVSSPLANAHFALYREVTVDGITLADYDPMSGYEDLVSQATTGLVPQIDETLPVGAYYITETQAPPSYDQAQTMRFSIDDQGVVRLDPTNDATLTSEIDADGTLAYTISIKNFQNQLAPTGYAFMREPLILILLAGIAVAVVAIATNKYSGKGKNTEGR